MLPGPFCSCLFCRGSNWGEQYKSNMREIRLRRQLYHSRRNMIFQEHNELMKSSDFFITSSTPPKVFRTSPRSFGRRTKTPFLRNSGLFIFMKCPQSKKSFLSPFFFYLLGCWLALPCLVFVGFFNQLIDDSITS